MKLTPAELWCDPRSTYAVLGRRDGTALSGYLLDAGVRPALEPQR